jgi:S-adenosyl-L-methionine hydrolase (adenosine-forming)
VTRITLLTDFGTRDGYVAAMKGVIAGIAADALVEDAGHDLPAGDVTAAAHALAAYWLLYPAGAIHVVVVDPGVGTARRALAVRAAGRFLVGPDNGCLSPALATDPAAEVVAIESQLYLRSSVSATFHGRDVFAPAAAHLARGVVLGELGPAVADPSRLEGRQPRPTARGLIGEVVHIDRFGNLITNIPGGALAPGHFIQIAGHGPIPVVRTYGDVATGELVALVGSSGFVEIAVASGDAAARLAAERGCAVVLAG